ncbi:MAG: ACT domain protein [Candidatus Methanomethylophilaceae archaeon]|nr:ACT domain protein [Candidatus Methanomethylophilaceae archaeon]
MKNWEFSIVNGSKIMIDNRLSDMMGLVDGGYIYSTLFEYVGEGPKRYELILSMYPQENYRTLTSITMYMQDVPGASAQAAKFLSSRGINILNSLSLDGMSDTTIIWRILADLSFVGEMDILKEKFEEAKSNNDPSVSLLSGIEIKPADIGRVFRVEPSKKKNEIRRAAPVTFKDGAYDLSIEYGDILNDVDGQNILLLADLSSWMVSVTFFKKETRLVKMELEIPDCPGSLGQALEWIASTHVNLISVFSKVKISYQTTTLELVADFSTCKYSVDEMKKELPKALEGLNGIFELKEFEEFN